MLFVVCLVVAIHLASAASAAVIGAHTINYESPAWSEDVAWHADLWFSNQATQPNIALFNGPDPAQPFLANEPGVDIFSNVGRTFWASSDQDDPEFSRVVSTLTNGTPAYIWLYIGTLYAGIGWPVRISSLLGRPDDRPASLQGYTIDRIGLTITSASHTINPEAVYAHTYSMAVTCTIEGNPVVPEPTPFVTMIGGIAGLCGFRYRYWLKRIC